MFKVRLALGWNPNEGGKNKGQLVVRVLAVEESVALAAFVNDEIAVIEDETWLDSWEMVATRNAVVTSERTNKSNNRWQ